MGHIMQIKYPSIPCSHEFAHSVVPRACADLGNGCLEIFRCVEHRNACRTHPVLLCAVHGGGPESFSGSVIVPLRLITGTVDSCPCPKSANDAYILSPLCYAAQ